MAGGGGGFSGASALLSGLFGSFQNSIQAHASTADLWSDLRTNAATWYYQAQGGGETPTEDELQETGRRILSEQGVGIQQVNQYRALSNQWATAKRNLQEGNGDDQVTANQIFRPPWATSADSAVPDRYRIRVRWDSTGVDGNPVNQWSSYELTAPVGSINDALDQAGDKVAGDQYLQLLAGTTPLEVGDYEIEQI